MHPARSRPRPFGRVASVLAFALLGMSAVAVPALAAAPTGSAFASKPHYGGHGHAVVFSTKEDWRKNRVHAASGATGSGPLTYAGGVDGIGVTTGAPKVYLVFWGSQWGQQGIDGNGYTTLTGDPQGVAPRLQAMIKGLGTSNEAWSGVTTQYCEGVATGSTSCPVNSQHVGYPAGGALAGVWADPAILAPAQATGQRIGAEAVAAASHFGNNGATANRNAQYVIVSPSGTHPDGFNTNSPTANFCAWHDWNGDTTMSGGAAASSVGDVAFTNMPYLTDMGTSCGASYVNAGAAGTLDGVTIVEGHEYAETITDQNPAGGWTDTTGYENGDKCAWVGVGGTGGAGNVTMATGSFPMQATWSNDANGCQISHPTVTNGAAANTVTVTNPGNQSTAVNATVSKQVTATDSASGQTLTWAAAGLPAGLSISSSTGLISGKATTAGTYSATVSARDTTGASGSSSFTWTVTPPAGTCPSPGQKLGNAGFESGAATPWTATAGVIDSSTSQPAHTGAWKAWLDGYGTAHTDSLSQTVALPAGCSSYQLTFWLHISTSETTTTTAYDKLTVQAGATTLATYSNLSRNTGYVQQSFDLGSFAGKTVTVKFSGVENSSRQTSFMVDDTAMNVR